VKRFDLVLLGIVAAFIIFVGAQAVRAPRPVRTAEAAGPAADGAGGAQASGDAERSGERGVGGRVRDAMRGVLGQGRRRRGPVLPPASAAPGTPPAWVRALQEQRLEALPPPERDPAEESRLLSELGPHTYIGAILEQNDSTLVRWPERDEPLLVWVQTGSHLAGWQPELVRAAQEGFTGWMRTAIPVRFAFTGDSVAADVHVLWVDSFSESRVAIAYRVTDRSSWIVAATITMAVRSGGGEPLPLPLVRIAALHEVGHLLGLDHSPTPTDIMAGEATSVIHLSPGDISTVRLLYWLPPGRVR
jgi:hypothetical protein